MNWHDKVVADDSLSKGAKRLAGVIAEKYAASTVLFCSMSDSDCAGALNTSTKVIKTWRHELMERGYLMALQYGAGKQFYSMRPGYPASDMEISA
jgi:hypothetical protein